MARISLLLSLLFTLPGMMTAFGQENRYVVYFTDKDQTPYSLDAPSEFLSERSIERRERQGLLLDERDLPVDPDYLEQVRTITGDIYYPSKWLNAVLVQCSEEEILAVSALPVVSQTDLVAEGTRLPEGGRVQSKFENQSDGSVNEAANDFQLALHGINMLHEAGFLGQGMMVAVMDGGFAGVDTIAALRHIYEEERVLISENIVNQSTVQFNIPHGTNVLSILAGVIPDQYQGIVPEATYLLFGTEDPFSEQRVEEYNWIIGAEKADSAGADVINTSLGYSTFDNAAMNYTYEDMDGTTTMITRGANWAAERGILVVVSAGNSGNNSWNYINAPADAKDILAVGAVTSSLLPASFSSFGPSFDGRIKPEVASLGSRTVLIRSDGTVGTASGTSFAAPVIAGFATALWQRDPSRTLTSLRTYIINLSSLVDNPDNQLGYGIPNIANQVTSAEVQDMAVMLYPNPVPAGSPLRIKLIKPVPEVRVFSADGREIPVRTVREGSELILADGLPAGLYFLQIRLSDRTQTLKVISN